MRIENLFLFIFEVLLIFVDILFVYLSVDFSLSLSFLEVLWLWRQHSGWHVRRHGSKVWRKRGLASGLLPVHHLRGIVGRFDLLRSRRAALLWAALRWAAQASLFRLRRGESHFLSFSTARWSHTSHHRIVHRSEFKNKNKNWDFFLARIPCTFSHHPIYQTFTFLFICYWISVSSSFPPPGMDFFIFSLIVAIVFPHSNRTLSVEWTRFMAGWGSKCTDASVERRPEISPTPSLSAIICAGGLEET